MSEPRDPTASIRCSRSEVPGTRRRKTNPRTKPARLDQLKEGDVVMQRADHPVVIVHIGRARSATVQGRGRIATRTFAVRTVYCRYVWADPDDPSWILGDFEADSVFARGV